MSYLDRLRPWCIIKPLPDLQRLTVARFRRRNDAEAHLQVLRRLIPHVTYIIIFDPGLELDDPSGSENPKSDRASTPNEGDHQGSD